MLAERKQSMNFIDHTYLMTIVISDNKATLYADGEYLVSATLHDGINRQGKVGLYKYWGRPDVTYANVKVQTDMTSNAYVSNSSGSVIIANAGSVDVSGSDLQLNDGFAVLTLKDSNTAVTVNDSTVQVKADTIMQIHPVGTDTSPVSNPPNSTLIRGEVTPKVSCASGKNFSLRTPVGNIQVICGQRTSNNAEFRTCFNRIHPDSLTGTFELFVTSGTVTFTDKNNVEHILGPGQNMTIQQNVPKNNWVLPIDNDKLYGNKDNIFMWTSYPGAAGYLIEVAEPGKDFSEENPNTVEFTLLTGTLYRGNYTEVDDMVLFSGFLGKPDSSVLVKARVFPVDANGKILQGSTASDEISVFWE